MSSIPEKGQILYNNEEKAIKIGDGIHDEESLQHVNFKIIRGKLTDHTTDVLGDNEAFIDTANMTLYFADGTTELQSITPIVSSKSLNDQVSTNDEIDDMLNEVFS